MPARKRHEMTAIVSGQAGIVVLFTRTKISCRRISAPEYVPCHRRDIPYLFSDASDVISIAARSPTQAFRILENEWANERTLHLILIILDHESHLRAKRLASETLEELLVVPTAQQFVLHRLYSQPLPQCADMVEALALAQESRAKVLYSVIATLREDQPKVREIRERWDQIDPMLFGDFEVKRSFEQVAVEEGLFFSLCRNDSKLSVEVVASWLSNPRLKDFENHDRILQLWVEPFVQSRKAVRPATQLDLFDEDSFPTRLTPTG
jgi:hypothetical protein